MLLNIFETAGTISRPWVGLHNIDTNRLSEWKDIFMSMNLNTGYPKLNVRLPIQPTAHLKKWIQAVEKVLSHMDREI